MVVKARENEGSGRQFSLERQPMWVHLGFLFGNCFAKTLETLKTINIALIGEPFVRFSDKK